MKKNNLTPFDEFMICKNKDVSDFNEKEETKTVYEETNEIERKLSPKYKKYLRNQLRRTTPSNEKVMTPEEFSVHSVRNGNVFKQESETTSEKEVSAKSLHFRKFGKILLCGYVIIMLALALIVIVKTTTVDNMTPADASDAYVDNSNKIERMQDEEAQENDDWFDSFCDSLK